MIVGLDIDGVVADFLSPFLLVLEQKIGTGPIPVESVTDFKFNNHPLLTEKAVWGCMETVSYDPSFWEKMPSLLKPSEWQRLEDFDHQHRLVFITHRYVRDTYDIHGVTCEWLRRNGISKPVVHFTQDGKGALIKDLGIELFVDDRYENCQDVAEKSEAVVLMPHRIYNQSFSHPRVKRIWKFNELFAYLHKEG